MCDHDTDCRDGSDESPECGKHLVYILVHLLVLFFISSHTDHRSESYSKSNVVFPFIMKNIPRAGRMISTVLMASA